MFFFRMPNKMFTLNCVKKYYISGKLNKFPSNYTTFISYKLTLHLIYINRKADDYIMFFKRLLYIVFRTNIYAVD